MCVTCDFVGWQFKEEVEKGGTGFSLPYKMEKGRIEDSNTGTSYSIKWVQDAVVSLTKASVTFEQNETCFVNLITIELFVW